MWDDPEALMRFAEGYTAAWCSQIPERVASHFSPNGTLTINDGKASVGRQEIGAVAASFMAAFPDLTVLLNELISGDELVEYRWTLTGLNTGSGGRGHRVSISGHERWRMSDDGLIAESIGRFDATLYQRQLEHGIDG